MNHSDFLDSLRDDADDVLVRHAYADWLDERGDPAGEFYRLCGDVLELDPGSLDWQLANARRERLRHLLIDRRIDQTLQLQSGARMWREDVGNGLLLVRRTAGSLDEQVNRYASELPFYGLKCGRFERWRTQHANRDWSWVRALSTPEVRLLHEAPPGVVRGLRRLDVQDLDEALTHIASLTPHLHALDVFDVHLWPLDDLLPGLDELRHCVVRSTVSESAELLRRCPPTLRSLEFVTRSSLPDRLPTPLPDLTSLFVTIADSDDAFDFGTFSRSPLLQTVRRLDVALFTPHRIATPEPPPESLATVRWEELGNDRALDLRPFCEVWGRSIQRLQFDAAPQMSSQLFPLLSSESLRELTIWAAGDDAFLKRLPGSTLSAHLESLEVHGGVSAVGIGRLADYDWPSLRGLQLVVANRLDVNAPLDRLLNNPFVSTLERLNLGLSTGHRESNTLTLPDNFADRLGSDLRILELDGLLLTPTIAESLARSNLPEQLDRLTVVGTPVSHDITGPLRSGFSQLRSF